MKQRKLSYWCLCIALFAALGMVFLPNLARHASANTFASTTILTAGAVNARTNVPLQGINTINLKEDGPGHITPGTVIMSLSSGASFKAVMNIARDGNGDLVFTNMDNSAAITFNAAGGALADGDLITIVRTNSDTSTDTVILELDVNNDGVVAGHVAVTGLAAANANAADAAQNAAATAAALNGDGTFYATAAGAKVTVYNCGNAMAITSNELNAGAIGDTAGNATNTKVDVTGRLVIEVANPSTIATTLIISGAQIETVGTSVGDEVKAYLDPTSTSTGITTGESNGVVVANIVNGSTTSSVSATKNLALGLSNQTINDFIIKENIGNSLQAGTAANPRYIDLTINTSGVTFTGIPAVANFVVSGGTTLAINAAGAQLLANSTILRIPVTASSAANTQGGTITIKNLAFTVSDSAAEGDLVVNVSGTAQPTDEDVVVGSIVAIGTTTSVEGNDIKTNLLVRTNDVPANPNRTYSIGNLVIKETAGASLLPNRNITIDAPAGVQFQDAGAATASGSTLAIGAPVLNSSKTRITIPVTASSQTGSPGQIKLSSLELIIDETLTSKDIILHVAGNAGVTEEDVKVAEANPATINEAGTAPDVSIGVQAQSVADITITEQRKGALLAGNNLNIILPNGVTFASKPTVTVSQGNLTLATNIPDPSGAGWFAIPLATSSTVASTIEISDIKLTLDNTVPVGPLSVDFGGAAGPAITKVTVANCITGLIPGTLSSVQVEPETLSVGVGSTAVVTVKGFDGQNNQLNLEGRTVTFTSSDPNVATVGEATISGNTATATVTGVAEGTCQITATVDSVNSSNAVDVTVTAAPAPEPVPRGQNTRELSGADRANAPFTFGSVVTGGDTMELAVNLPAYEAGVDIYVALYIPNLGLYFVDQSGALTSDVVAYRVNVTDAVQATIVPEFQVCPALSGLAGTWGAYTLVVPTNNGDLSGFDWSSSDYDLQWYNFDVNCQ